MFGAPSVGAPQPQSAAPAPVPTPAAPPHTLAPVQPRAKSSSLPVPLLIIGSALLFATLGLVLYFLLKK